MDSILKWSGVVALVILAILFVPKLFSAQALGGATNYDTISASVLQIGSGCNSSFGTCTGTSVSQIVKGTCNLIGAPTITATSSAAMDCAVSGVVAGDTVFFTQPTTTPSTFEGWRVTSANASSTSGFITFILYNATGANAIPPITATSSIGYLILR